MEVSNLFVCVMGMSVTFFGLTCLIGLTVLLGRISKPAEVIPPQMSAPAAVDVPNRQEMIAAVSAALAEELGTDVTAIRILSFRKVS